MITVFFDTNIFDKLSEDEGVRVLLTDLRKQGQIRLFISRTVRDELAASPHMDLLASLPIEIVGNAAPVAGIMCAGDYLGNAEHFFQHKGQSNKLNDAQVATAAELLGDWLVSEDTRLRHRQEKLAIAVKVLTYEEFVLAARATLLNNQTTRQPRKPLSSGA